jgi:hypothetical protein
VRITSFNITDVGYHYIGLRVLAGMPTATRDEQNRALARSVLKYARDKSLRLMLPEPKSSFEAVGEKICQELAHFEFASAIKGRGYELTDAGHAVLTMLNNKQNVLLRRTMAKVHLQTYDNLRAVVHAHIERKAIFSPTIETVNATDVRYVASLLRPTFGELADGEAQTVLERMEGRSAKKIEDALRERVVSHAIEGIVISVPLFRSMCDRLVSLRLLNIMKVSSDQGDFAKSYSPCVERNPTRKWHKQLDIALPGGVSYTLFLSEPDMSDIEIESEFLTAIDSALKVLTEQAGYYDLPDVRDFVCEELMIPEAAFDEGVNSLLDRKPAPITAGLTYEGISGRRKPLVRIRDTTQIFNLIRRTS